MIITKHARDLKPGDRFRYRGTLLTVGPDEVRGYVRIRLFGGDILALDPETSLDVLDKDEVNQGLLERVIKVWNGNEETARRWLATHNLALGGKTPEEVAKTGAEGIRQVLAILESIDKGGVF